MISGIGLYNSFILLANKSSNFINDMILVFSFEFGRCWTAFLFLIDLCIELYPIETDHVLVHFNF